MRATRSIHSTLMIVGAGLVLSSTGWATPARALTLVPGEEVCWTVSDSTEDDTDSDAADALHRINRLDADPATNETAVGTGTGTRDIEAIALRPGAPVLFAADAGVLGTIDLDTGVFAAIGSGIGTGEGSAGEVRFDDVDGLNFDPATGHLYGSQRENRRDDILLRVDPATGAFVPGAFDGADYVVVEALPGLSDIDDLAIDPTDGQMYAIANTDGRGDHLVGIDKSTGEVIDVGRLGVEDMEGLSFAPDGQLIGSTGKVHGEEGMWDLDKTDGSAGNRRPLDNARDYEGLACLLTPVPPAPVPPGTLTVRKESRPGSTEPFAFSLSGGPLPAALSLVDGREVSYGDLPAGTYTVTETAMAGWALSQLTCTDPTGGTTTDVDTRQATVAVAPGDAVTCTFVNTRDQVREPFRVPDPPPAPVQVQQGVQVRPELPRTGSAGNSFAAVAGGLLLVGGFLVGIGPGRRRTTKS